MEGEKQWHCMDSFMVKCRAQNIETLEQTCGEQSEICLLSLKYKHFVSEAQLTRPVLGL